MRKITAPVAVLLGVLLYSCVALANPLPYNGKVNGDGVSAHDVFAQMSTRPHEDRARQEFFSEIEKNLSLTEEELQEMDFNNRMKVEAIGPGYETAGLEKGRSRYWREARPQERVVLVQIGTEWKPAFLTRCANPVRPVHKPPPPIARIEQPPPSPEIEVPSRPCGVWQGQPVERVDTYTQYYAEWPLPFSDYYSSVERHSVFIPTESLSDENYDAFEEGER